MKILIAIASLFLVNQGAMAHDGGHHDPHAADPSKRIESVFPKSGDKAQALYKGALTKDEEGTVRLSIYDISTNAPTTTDFKKTAQGTLTAKNTKELKFDLNLEGANFVGKAPKPPKKPFNLEFTLNDGSQDLVVGFKKLD
jgi:hypothetical protein